ncbi:hypothetical protein N7492_002405 [Penicillium capsulatum]|uniref:Uncharacterized protein n=1 Tax=Penicillium capsulatum TaxID=69766 RepID=A0A9W9IIH1_9EURO|nr:hypothetical protein N7492_002405 [Penicillium capsulatum]KAJ6122990.1 hypothetical protein N7512_005455 [Penicillium capsulatum]
MSGNTQPPVNEMMSHGRSSQGRPSRYELHSSPRVTSPGSQDTANNTLVIIRGRAERVQQLSWQMVGHSFHTSSSAQTGILRFGPRGDAQNEEETWADLHEMMVHVKEVLDKLQPEKANLTRL